jgi:hypothetical protein
MRLRPAEGGVTSLSSLETNDSLSFMDEGELLSPRRYILPKDIYEKSVSGDF